MHAPEVELSDAEQERRYQDALYRLSDPSYELSLELERLGQLLAYLDEVAGADY